MRRYLLFGGKEVRHPSGGWYDFKGSFSSSELARHHAEDHSLQWWHITDVESGEVLDSYGTSEPLA